MRLLFEMKEETGLTILEPRLVGVKQFPIENGRYVVLLFKATRWSGDLISSDEDQMEWIEYSELSMCQGDGSPDTLPKTCCYQFPSDRHKDCRGEKRKGK